jgi:hypothetical protein
MELGLHLKIDVILLLFCKVLKSTIEREICLHLFLIDFGG